MRTAHTLHLSFGSAPQGRRPGGRAPAGAAGPWLTAAVAVLLAAMGAGAALADESCPPGSSAPDCAAPAAPATDSLLTASFQGAPDAHDGNTLFTIEIRFSEAFAGLRLPALKQALEVTGGRVVNVKRTVRGENGGVTISVRPSSTGDLTVTLPAAFGGGAFSGAASWTVPGPAPAVTTPLTASFHGLPSTHDGKKVLVFELRFSEDFAGRLDYKTLRDAALQVENGRVVNVKRAEKGQNRRWVVTVRPASGGEVRLELAAGSVTTEGGLTLAGTVSATVPGAPQTAGQTKAPEPVTAPEPERAVLLIPEAPIVPDRSEPPRTGRMIGLGTTDPSGPTGLFGAGTVTNMNTFGPWGHWSFRHVTNQAPDIPLRLRQRSLGQRGFSNPTVPAFVEDENGEMVRPNGWFNYQVEIEQLWLTYPANPAASEMRVHVEIRRATHEREMGKTNFNWFTSNLREAGSSFHDPRLGYTDFFHTRAHLTAPGTAVQPVGAASASATWSGKVIAVDNAQHSYMFRGDEIGGDAAVTVNWDSSNVPSADISLTKLRVPRRWKSVTTGPVADRGQTIATYPDQKWTGLAITGGSFSHSDATRSIQGQFANEKTGDSGHGSNADTVGGVFDVFGSMKGGFVAKLP